MDAEMWMQQLSEVEDQFYLDHFHTPKSGHFDQTYVPHKSEARPVGAKTPAPIDEETGKRKYVKKSSYWTDLEILGAKKANEKVLKSNGRRRTKII